MPDLFDYLTWRGDIPMAQVPLGPVDALILTALSYVRFRELAPAGLSRHVTIGRAAQAFLALPEETRRRRCRCREDLQLLERLQTSPRFSPLTLCCCEELFQPREEMQFAAMAVLLGEQGAFLSFRGTDATLVGWKEDLNMSFQDSVPAQRAALDYTRRFAAAFPGPLYLGGHSKGGNLAVFAAALCPSGVRDRIAAVYNNDGPGFTGYVLERAGYLELVPRIRTFIPQSSVIGMLLEHEEPYTVVRSRQVGIFQHDPYSWEVLGGDFVREEEVTNGSRLTDRALKAWINGLTAAEREAFVDALYELLSSADAHTLAELAQPKNLYALLRTLVQDTADTRQLMTRTLGQLARAAADVLRQEEEKKDATL